MGVESLKCINKSQKEFKLVYQNGDILEGTFDKFVNHNLTFMGKITYSDGRYPSFTGKIIDNKPKSGKGICFLYNNGTIYNGNFNSEGKFTITEEDGTIHKMIQKPSLNYDREIIYPDGKKYKGRFKQNKITSRTVRGEGSFRMKEYNIKVEGSVSDSIFNNSKVTNLTTGTIFNFGKFDIDDYGILSIHLPKTEIQFLDGSKTIIDHKYFKKFGIDGNKYEYFDKSWTLEIQKNESTLSKSEVEGILKDPKNNYIKIGRFQLVKLNQIRLISGLTLQRSGLVYETIFNKKTGKKINTIEQNGLSLNGKNLYWYVKGVELYMKMNTSKFQFGWNKGLNGSSLLFEGESKYGRNDASGMIVLCQGSGISRPGSMVYGKKFINLDVQEVDGLKIEEYQSRRRKVLVLDGNNNLKYVILGNQ